MIYGRVPRMDRIIIVATGPSLSGVSPALIEDSNAFIIAVNEAVSKIRAHAFFTCDPSRKVRLLLQVQRRGVKYIAAVPDDYGTPRARAPVHRAPPEPNVTYLRRLTGDGPWSHRPGLSEEQDAIHTGNSAYGALGVAYLMGVRKIALLGVDGMGAYGWGLPGQPNDLSHLGGIFESAVPQLRKRKVEVANGSPDSGVTCFPRMTPGEAVQWIG